MAATLPGSYRQTWKLWICNKTLSLFVISTFQPPPPSFYTSARLGMSDDINIVFIHLIHTTKTMDLELNMVIFCYFKISFPTFHFLECPPPPWGAKDVWRNRNCARHSKENTSQKTTQECFWSRGINSIMFYSKGPNTRRNIHTNLKSAP